MRLDKFLKESRIIKRRTIAKEVSDLGGVFINSKLAKPSTEVKINDVLEIHFKDKVINIKVLKIDKKFTSDGACEMYEIININQ